jgi:peroxiredoxin family protein
MTVTLGQPITDSLVARLGNLEQQLEDLEKQLEAQQDSNTVNLICFSGEWDRLFAALSIAAGSLAMGMEVHLFFTFWAVSALRSADRLSFKGKSFLQSMFSWIMPRGPRRAPLSRMNFGGIGKTLMRRVMKREGVADIDQLFEEVQELGAHIHLCDTTTTLFGLQCFELESVENIDHCGVTTFLSHALKSRLVLFI